LGYGFKSNTDTEVILYAYKEWGFDCLKKFNGMWAFCIYDKTKNILFLSRDRFGIKPLYIHHDSGRFIFSSEIPPLLKSGMRVKPNEKLIYDFLLYNTTDHTDETFFKPIMRLPKASYVIFDLERKSLEMVKWWNPTQKAMAETSDSETIKKLHDLLSDSVDLELQSDVPVGTCLSGGLDSSTIACLIDSSKKTSIKTFSVVFPGFKLDETKYIDMVSTQKGIQNFKTNPTSKTIAEDIYDFIKAQAEPVPGPSPYSQYCVMRLAKENNVTVLLDGQGSDELLAGYHYFHGFYVKGLLLGFNIKKLIREVFSLMKNPDWALRLYSIFFLLIPHSMQQLYFHKKSNINPEFYNKTKTVFAEKFYSCHNLKESLIFHINHKLEHLLTWEDHNSMRFSREARVPFLDHRVAEFILRLPEEYIINNGLTKKILRDSMKGTVPAEILSRRDKIGFATPEIEWLRSEELKKLTDKLFTNKQPMCAEYIDLEKTRRMIREHNDGRREYSREIWKTIFLEIWLQTFFAGGGSKA